MKKWDVVELGSEIVGAICCVIGIIASVKRDEDLDERVHRIMLEDKTKYNEHENS